MADAQCPAHIDVDMGGSLWAMFAESYMHLLAAALPMQHLLPCRTVYKKL